MGVKGRQHKVRSVRWGTRKSFINLSSCISIRLLTLYLAPEVSSSGVRLIYFLVLSFSTSTLGLPTPQLQCTCQPYLSRQSLEHSWSSIFVLTCLTCALATLRFVVAWSARTTRSVNFFWNRCSNKMWFVCGEVLNQAGVNFINDSNLLGDSMHLTMNAL